MTLVGYGPREESGGRRRRRRPEATAAGAQAAFNTPPGHRAAPGSGARGRRARARAGAAPRHLPARPGAPRRSPSRRCASWPRTSASTSPRSTPTGPNGTVSRDDVQSAAPTDRVRARLGVDQPGQRRARGTTGDAGPDQGRAQAHRRGHGAERVHRAARDRVRHLRRHRDDGAARPGRRASRVPGREGQSPLLFVAKAVHPRGCARRRRSTPPGTTRPARSCSSTT